MFAVIRTGGKQYKVSKDDIITVEKLAGDAGAKLEFTDVLAIGEGPDTTFGTPLVEGARVKAAVLEQTKGDKIIVFKKSRRKNYRRKRGHRQQLTVLRITELSAGGGPSPRRSGSGRAGGAAAKAPAKEKAPAKTKPTAKAKAPAKAKPKAEPKPKADPKPKASAKSDAKAPAKAKAKPKTAPKGPGKGSAKGKEKT
ncbi:MAG: 50S ribosomal protein L21 [Proteobacteria bacterium]|nr:50S ribosomal protein L21 [Pseudomonadota bacterium]